MTTLLITSVTPDPRRAGAMRVHTSGGRFWTISRSTAATLGIAPGMAVSSNIESALDAGAEAEGALRAGLRALARRPFARRDLGRRLRQKAHSEPAVESALEELQQNGLLDDARFAVAYVESRAARGRGPARLRRDLAVMGVSRQDIDAAVLAHWPEGGPGEEAPRALAIKRLARLPDLPRDALRRRLLAFLGRRGYFGDTARKAVAEALRGVIASGR